MTKKVRRIGAAPPERRPITFQTFESAHAEWWAGLRGFARTRKKSTDKARSAWIKHAGREPQRQDSLPQ